MLKIYNNQDEVDKDLDKHGTLRINCDTQFNFWGVRVRAIVGTSGPIKKVFIPKHGYIDNDCAFIGVEYTDNLYFFTNNEFEPSPIMRIKKELESLIKDHKITIPDVYIDPNNIRWE